jgi:DNA-binding Lrp family transcriptional regulator
MDRTDAKIIKILRRDARTPFVEVAQKVGMTEGAIRARVKRMVKDGSIERFTLVSRSGGIRALVGVRTKPGGPTDRIARTIRKAPGVSAVFEVTGELDLFVLVDAEDTSALNKTIESIRRNPAVLETKSMTILGEH